MLSKIAAFVVKDCVLPFLAALLLCVTLFWPTVSKGWLPIATDIVTGFYDPWISLSFEGMAFPFPVKNLESFDTVTQNFPWKSLIISQYKKRQWPFWNSTQLSGVPLAAEFLAGAFYPLNIIFLVLPFVWGWGVLAMLQVYLAFVFMYWFLRSTPISKVSSAFGAALLSLSGFTAGFFHAGVIIHSFLWTPMALFGVNKLFKTKNARWSIIIGLSISLTGLASHFQILAYTTGLVLVYQLFKFYVYRNKKILILGIISVVMGVLLTSIQLVPSVELLRYGSRISNFNGQIDDILSKTYHLLLFWAPNFLGNPGRLNYFGGPSYYHEYSFYMGISTLLLVFVSVSQVRMRKTVMFWLAVFFATLLMAFNNPLSRLPRDLGIPLLGSITPTRAYAYMDLAIAFMAALGLDIFLSNKRENIKNGLILFVVVGLVSFSIVFLNAKLSGALFLKYLFDTTPAHNAISIRSLILPVILFFFSVFVALYSIKKRRGAVMSILLVLLLLTDVGDLIRQFRIQNGFVPLKSVFPVTKITSFLSSLPLPPRIISVVDGVLPPNIGAYYGWENIDGYQANGIRKYVDTFAKYDAGSSGNERVFSKMVSLREPKSQAIDLLGVDYVFSTYPLESLFTDPHYKRILTEGKVIMYENSNSIPRFSLSQENLVDKGDLELMKSGRIEFEKEGKENSSIKVEEYQPNYFTLKVMSNQESQILQTMVIEYPGWKVFVNGQRQKLFINGGGFMGVEVPKGNSQVRFLLNPQSFRVGLVISLLSLFGLLILPSLYNRFK